MPGRILIVDPVATNRIVMKVKMLAARFVVDTCTGKDEAIALIERNRPDLILFNLTGSSNPLQDFCRSLRARPETASIAVIAVGAADTSIVRFTALDAGADDVMPHPVNDALLLARIRSLLRVRSAGQELALRESTSRALGFKEQRAEFAAAARVSLLTANGHIDDAQQSRLKAGLRTDVQAGRAHEILSAKDVATYDLFVIDTAAENAGSGGLFGLVSDLRARAQTRLAMQLVLVPADRPEAAAMYLDLGADDVMPASCDPAELVLRARRLIARKRQQDKLRDTVRSGLNAAVTDPLTGLFNRRYVDAHLSRLADESLTSGRVLAVMMIDIDHFKAVNDTHGHAAGDRVLVEVAQRLRNNLRAVDLVARVGGEEFLIAMPGTTIADARLAANRLRALVNARPIHLENGKPAINVTVSVGVAVSGKSNARKHSVKKIWDQADQALYAAKSAGRDQVAMSARSAA